MSDANGRCRACNKPVTWARTERNKWLPLDPKPNPAGNQAVWCDSDGTWKTRQITENGEPQWGFEVLHMPHMASCEKQQPRKEPPPLPPNVIPISRVRRKQGAAPRKGQR